MTVRLSPTSKMTPHKQRATGSFLKQGKPKKTRFSTNQPTTQRSNKGVESHVCSGRKMLLMERSTKGTIWSVNHLERKQVLGYELHLGRKFHFDNEDLGSKFFAFETLDKAKQYISTI